MITKRKLRIYADYKGDIDNWTRFDSKEEKQLIGKGEWSTIESLIQDFRLVKEQLGPEGYYQKVIERANEICDNNQTIEELKRMAESASY